MSTSAFYDTLSSYYHLIFPDWLASIERQGRALDSIIRSEGGLHLHTVLDSSCGIGTQSLGLAALGYEVTASDISAGAVKRARWEAQQRGLLMQASVADMRYLHVHHGRSFDVVLACDNSVPHLLSNEDILTAFQQFYACTNPGGICLVSVRDYAAMDFSSQTQVHPYGVREVAGVRYVLLQVWDLKPPLYDTTFYIIEHRERSEAVVHATRATYYTVSIPILIQLMEQAKFQAVRRIDGEFFQPVIVGHKQ
jgi:SAM-dependent methyltransferase